MIITYPTCRPFIYMGQTIAIPLWVKYVALLPRTYTSNNSSLMGFAKKPKLTAEGTWISKGRQEEIGICNYVPEDNKTYLTLEKVK